MTNSNLVAETGIGIVKTQLGKLDLIFRELPTQDHGIDGQIELVNLDRATGRLIAVQVKTGDSYFTRQQDGAFVYLIKSKHYGYWIDHCLPVILVLCDARTNTCYWQQVTKENCEVTGSSYRICVPSHQQFDAKNYDRIVDLASPLVAVTDYTIFSTKDLSHALARRIQLKAVAHSTSQTLSKSKIAAIARHMVDLGRTSQYVRDQLSSAAHPDREADVVFGFIYLRETDETAGNWICKFDWISPSLEASARPMESNGECAGENLKIEWNSGMAALASFLDDMCLPKDQYLKIVDDCLREVQRLLRHLAKAVTPEGIDACDPAFVARASSLDHSWGDNGGAPYECRQLDEKMNEVVASIGNAALLIEQRADRTEANLVFLLGGQLRSADKALRYALLLRDDLR